MGDNEKQARSGGRKERGRKRGREVNKSWTDRWRSAKLSPSARHDPFQRHVGSNQRAKKSRAMGESEREREEEGFTLKYVDPRAILGLFSLHPAGCSGRIPVRHAGRESVYRMIQKHRIIFLSLWTGARKPLLPPPSYSSAPRGARGHVTTIMPVLLLLSRPPPRCLLLSSSSATSFLPSFVLFTSHLAVRISLLPQITYPLNESRRKRCLPR